jgi:methionyl-tRNA formyltransferase
VRWNRPARELFNQVRGSKPWPGTYTHWLRPTDEPLRLILDQVSVISDATPASVSPGEIISVSEQGLHVATGRGVLSVDRVQPAGKKSMTAAEFLRGHAITVGQRLGG